MTGPSPVELTVAAVLERAGRFLFVEEVVGGRTVINQPAGHVESGETLVEAVIRETLEETAWRFVPEAVCGVYLWTAPESNKTFLRVGFCGQGLDHDPQRPLDEGILRSLWLSPAELAARSGDLRSPMVVRCIDDYRCGHREDLAGIESLGRDDLARVATRI